MTHRHKFKRLLFALPAACLWLAVGMAESSELKPQLIVDGTYITLGDLFADAENAASVVVAEAPAPGMQSHLSARSVAGIAAANGINWQPLQASARIKVRRRGDKLSQQELIVIMEDAIRQTGRPANLRVRLSRGSQTVILPTDGSVNGVLIEDLELDPQLRRFSATAVVKDGSEREYRTVLRGQLTAVEQVPVLAQSMTSGDIISDADIVWRDVPAQRVSQATIRSASDLIGMTARRSLRAQEPIRHNDVRKPIAVKKGTLVTMIVQSGNMVLTARAKAQESGAIGDVIRLTNITSKRAIEAEITAIGVVRVMRARQIARNY